MVTIKKPPQLSGIMFALVPTAGGHGLEFPSITQPVVTGRMAAYHVSAHIFAYLIPDD